MAVYSPPSALLQVAQRVDNLDRAIAFYSKTLGLPLMAKFDPPGLAFINLSGVRVMLDAVAEGEVPGAILYLRVDDIQDSYRNLRQRGVEFAGEPHMINRDDAGLFGPKGMEEWMAFFKDSEGNTLAIASRAVPSS
ncbi:MAG: VOC family protein [Dehalococcoidia bacterium]|nr:VOC family protein [Dehalococcoidia bacterium]